jgi:hypothetical protein
MGRKTKRNMIDFILSIWQLIIQFFGQWGRGTEFLLRPDGTTTMPYITNEDLMVFGLSRVDFVKDNNCIMNRVHPFDLPDLVKGIGASSLALSEFQWSGEIYHKDGYPIRVSIKSMPKKHANGDIVWYGRFIKE